MSLQAALLAQIQEDPRGPEGRVATAALADVLNDAGDRRGEFMGLQMLAEDWAPTHPKRAELEQQMLAFLKSCSALLLGETLQRNGVQARIEEQADDQRGNMQYALLSGGFVRHIRANAKMLLENIEGIFDEHPVVESLELIMPRKKKLKYKLCSRAARATCWNQVRRVVADNGRLTGRHINKLFPGPSNVEILSLRNNQLHNHEFTARRFPHLQHLYMNGNWYGNSAMIIGMTHALRSLLSLTVTDNEYLDVPSIMTNKRNGVRVIVEARH